MSARSRCHFYSSHFISALLLALLPGITPTVALAQADGVPIEPRRLSINDKQLLEKLGALRDEGKLLSMDDVRQRLDAPTAQPITLTAPADEPLPPAKIAALGRKALLRVGWYYLCHRCNNWHILFANGYALTADGVGVSCHHVVMPKEEMMREGYLFAMSTDGEIYPITSILAADEQLDTVIFRMEGSGFTPLRLNDQSAPGDAVYLVSDPKGIAGYFSAGQINRFYWERGRGDGDVNALAGVRHLRIDVSTNWAPGSSGAAILDECGNVVGHVTSISTEREMPAPDPAPPLAAAQSATQPATNPRRPRSGDNSPYILVLHEAIPARGVRLLAASMSAPPAPPAQ